MNDTKIIGDGPPDEDRSNDDHVFALPSGTQVGAFQIESVLGSGGFGITYRARHRTLGKSFALKEYFPHQFSYRETTNVRARPSAAKDYAWGLDRFEKEARALAKFKHPSIVDISDIFTANDTAYIVLAYEPAPSFGRWLDRLGRPPSQDELDRIVAPLLDALELVHAHGMLHRDIAPDNILIRPDASPVLIDFGAARDELQHRSGPVTAVVKPGYSPPEQYDSNPSTQGAWTDIYGFGATLYHAVAGPLQSDEGDRFDARVRTAAAAKSRGLYRPEFLAAIDWALELAPAARPQSVREWRARLEALNAPPVVRLRANGWWLAGAGALLLGALSISSTLWSCRVLGLQCNPDPKISVTDPLKIEIALPKPTFAVGDDLTFSVRANKDCYFTAYTVGPNGKIENHDPAEEETFMGSPVLRANEWRLLPTKGHATVNPELGVFELGAICSKEPLASLGLSIAELRERARGGRRSFTFAIDNATNPARRGDVARTEVSYEVKP